MVETMSAVLNLVLTSVTRLMRGLVDVAMLELVLVSVAVATMFVSVMVLVLADPEAPGGVETMEMFSRSEC